jgi:adapter protein MecA 1/2
MDGFYYLLMDEDSEIMDPDNLIALLAEFGETSTITVFRLEEYGKEIIKEKALKVLNEHFK